MGYITALPYTGNIKDDVLKTALNVRKYYQPPINLEMRLQNGLSSWRILMTVPWITEYLINLDSVSLLLPVYNSLIKLLLSINASISGQLTSAAYFLRLCLGRLYQTEAFPRAMFYDSLNKKNCNKRKIKIETNALGEIGEEAFYECIPSLAALKVILNSGQTSVCIR